MNKYLVSYAVVTNCGVVISAENKNDAEDKFYRGEFDEERVQESEFIERRLDGIYLMRDVSTAPDTDERGTTP